MICREFGCLGKLDEKGNRINGESVRYNSFEGAEYLNNPNSIVFGDTSTKAGDTAGLVSRAIYDWAYSLRDVKDITEKLQHNALSEAGTMIDEKTGEMRQSLYSTEYVLPNTFFPHFITVDNISPELYVHLLSCIVNQYRYGAQTTTNANNITNHLVAIGLAPFEKPITSYTVSRAWNDDANKTEPPTIQSVKNLVISQMESVYGANKIVKDNDNKIEGLLNWIKELWDEKDKPQLKEIYAQAAKDCDAYLKGIKMITEGGSEKGKRGKKGKSEETTEQTKKTEVNDESLPDIG
jgi:CRISPR-associated protein Csc2